MTTWSTSLSNLLLLLLLLLLLRRFSAVALTSPSDVAALKAFKAAVKPNSIPPWSCLASWDFTAADPCASPRLTHFTCGLTCSLDSTRVTQLTLDSVGYSGQLSPLISQLSHLVTLDLADNNFHGVIPSSFSSLISLNTLVLRSNSFSGSLPESLTRLNSLESIDISHNSITGSLPDFNSLLNLRQLDLSYNKLTGSIPKLPKNLIALALKANSLSGIISKESFTESTQLEIVELAENSFTGTLGSWFFLLQSIQQVDLTNNNLTGIEVFPPKSTINGESDLVAVELGFNQIGGFAPANFAAFPRLSSLSMRYNRLRGEIPAEYERSKTLRRLFLDGNFLTGKPPARFIRADAEVMGSLGYNCLQGCPGKAKMCAPSQKPFSICKQAYGGKPKS